MSDKTKISGSFANPFASPEITKPISDHWRLRRRMANAVHAITEALVTSIPSNEELEEMAEALEKIKMSIETSERRFGLLEFVADGDHGGHGEMNHEHNAVGGFSNPLSPGINIWVEGAKAFGTTECGYAYEGPPGHIHGGYVAAILDQFLGMAQVAGGNPGMTGKLEIRYLKPTPLNTKLKLEAIVSRIDNRKTLVRGQIYANKNITAKAEGLFIRPTHFNLPDL